MNQITSTATRSPAASWANFSVFDLTGYFSRIAMALKTWRWRYQTSMQIAQVDARVLRDAGISEAQLFIEVNKPFWEK